MLVERAIELCKENSSLEHLIPMLECNITKEYFTHTGIDSKKLYIGYRPEDSGWVIGYRSGSSIVDIELLAYWWCVGIKELSETDFPKLLEGSNGSTFQPISRKRY